MCGRFTQTKSREEVLEELGGIELPPLFLGRYNVAPTQTVAVIRQGSPDRAVESIWGFVNPRSGGPIINARVETLSERPMFKDLLTASPENGRRGGRCLIPADGFYEWEGRQPYCFQIEEKRLFAFAGLYFNDRCVIITRAADGNMRGIHARMPVIFPLDKRTQWLEDCRIGMAPPLICRPVSRRVNRVVNDDPACLEPADQQGELF